MEMANKVLDSVKWMFDFDNKTENDSGDISDVSDDEDDGKREEDKENPVGILKADDESVVLPKSRSSKIRSSIKRLSFSQSSQSSNRSSRDRRNSNKRVSWLTMHRNKMREWDQRREEVLKAKDEEKAESEPKKSPWRFSFGRSGLSNFLSQKSESEDKSSGITTTKKSHRTTITVNSMPATSYLPTISESKDESGVGQAPLEESNIAGIGSKDDRALRKAAAKSEKAFKGVGKKVGLYVWRVENKRTANDTPDFGVKKWPKSDYGSFFSGDSYIVLNAYKPKDPLTGKLRNVISYDLHYWLGSESSQDEIGVAAYKAVELDALLDDAAIHHREIQFHESRLFQSYFPEVVYMKGGVDSGFRHVTEKEYQPRLLMVRHSGRNTKVFEIPCESSYMNHGDSFILDTGRKVYRWVGETSNFFERNRSGMVAHNIVSARCGKAIKAEPDEDFWAVVGPEDDIRPEDEPYVTEKCDETRLDASSINVWRISDSSGKLTFTQESHGRASIAILDTMDVFLVHANIGIWLWLGEGSTRQEKSRAMVIADKYIEQEQLPNSLPVTVLSENASLTNSLFNSLFTA
mmetsp:Transcript_10879/g.19208  ORF Transcript_10879/g.19208 Transcript_10879/m.19208 type:complete len:577 (+) Transcript_10879:76-1806(+)